VTDLRHDIADIFMDTDIEQLAKARAIFELVKDSGRYRLPPSGTDAEAEIIEAILNVVREPKKDSSLN
jgi:hypothetical protein